MQLIRLCPRGGGGPVCQALPWERSVNRGRLTPRATAAHWLLPWRHPRGAGSAARLFAGCWVCKGITSLFPSVSMFQGCFYCKYLSFVLMIAVSSP